MRSHHLLMALLIPLLFSSAGSFAQSLTIQGKVSNKSSGLPLDGATVSVLNTTRSTSTNKNGEYRLSLDGPGSIVVSYVGYSSKTVRVTGSGTYNVDLDAATQTMEDVVVVGYGTQKVTKTSGAISTVKAEDIRKMTPLRTEDALQGRAAGVNVIQAGTPGSKPTVLIRGIPSFSGTDPVVIIDGVPQSLTDLNSINANDIESINVLKDAATTAIYGVKGGNGVIVVTTKTGRLNLAPEVTLNMNYGVQQVMNTIGVLNATEYAAMINEGSTLSGGDVIFPNLASLGTGTNWQDQIFKNAPVQQYNLSVRGGSDKVNYFLSAGYMDQGGIVGGREKSFFSRGTFTSNINFALSKKLRFVLNTTGVLLKSRGIQENSFNSVIGSALNYDPTVSIYNDVPNTVGKYGFSKYILSEIFNPLTKLDNTYNKNAGNKLYGKFEMQYDLMKGLKLTSRFGYTKYDDNFKSFTPLVFYGINNVDNSMNADGSTVTDRHNNVYHAKGSNFNYTWETYGNYDFNVGGDHHFETVLGMSLAKLTGNSANATRQDVPFNSWEFADFTAATGINSSTNSNALAGGYYQYFRKNLSYFARANYDYLNRYLASVTVRRDGSFAFGSDNKFANFYSGSLGWVVSSEDFWNSKAINYFKLRASYGTIGNENVVPQFVGIISGGPSYAVPANSNGYNFDNIFYPGSTVGSAANNALRWEKQIQSNVGFDAFFLNRKVSLSADYFNKTVDGLLFTPSASLYLGTVPIPTSNIGSTKSNGIDATLGYNNLKATGIRLNTSLTFTTAKNLVTKTNDDGTARIIGGGYFNGQPQTVTVFEKGQTPGYFYGYKTLGLFQNQDAISKAALQPGAVPGDIQFADINNDGVINAADQTKIGDPFPDFTMGWSLNLGYKNFDFTAFTYASVGNDIYRAYERNSNFTNKFRSVLGRWTGEGTTNDARFPRYSFTDANSNIRVSDRYVEDGSFIKLKNVQLGYTLKPTSKSYFKSLRFYGQVKNAITLTKYTGFDPEISGGILETGIDRGAYPQARTYAIGLDINF